VRQATRALVLIDKPPAVYAGLLRSFGREIEPATCRTIGNPFDHGLALCGTKLTDGA
jgi:hypothetical protein